MSRIALLSLCALSLAAQDFYTGQAARLVIGQPVWSAQSFGVTERLLGSPSGIAFANGSLFVADSNRLAGSPNNNRILIFENIENELPELRFEYPVNDAVRCPVCLGVATKVLGQKDFRSSETGRLASNITVRSPSGVHSNGRMMVVADTDYNRVLVWRTLPTNINQAADLVLGQPDFTSTRAGIGAAAMRGPIGVWLDANNGLWVADSGNNRILFFGTPTRNGQEATLVLGQENLTTDRQPRLASEPPVISASSLLAPVSVSTDGRRLFVADLGLSRVLIWNSIPSRNAQPADVVVGQATFEQGNPNNRPNPFVTADTALYSQRVCTPTKDSEGKDVFPFRCAASLEYPRFALSDGRRLYVSDSGNDRVLVFNQIPTRNGAVPDAILGQQSEDTNASSDSSAPERVSASDSMKTPAALAHDGTNLYVADTFNRRIMVFTPGDFGLPISAVRNAASLQVYAIGSVTFTPLTDFPGENDEITLTIGRGDVKKEYKYKVTKETTISAIIDDYIRQISGTPGDPNVIATPNRVLNQLVLTAREGGVGGNNVTLEVKVSDNAKIQLNTSGASLNGGQDAARIAPYSLVTILGDNFVEATAVADLTKSLPRELGNVQVTFDGFRAPLYRVSPEGITAQIPASVRDATSANAVVLVKRRDGTIKVSAPVAILLTTANPGVFVADGVDPRPALAVHASSSATGTIAVDGTAVANDVASIWINEREYQYKVVEGDTLENITNSLVKQIADYDPEVTATRAFPFTTIRLQARVPGPAGNGIPFRAGAPAGAQVIMTALNSALCCANVEGAPITEANPAVPGQQITVYVTGMGVLKGDAVNEQKPGEPYRGPIDVEPIEFPNSIIGGRTARVLTCRPLQGSVGIYEVVLELNPDIPTDPLTNGTVAQQSGFVSNIFTIPVLNPRNQ